MDATIQMMLKELYDKICTFNDEIAGEVSREQSTRLLKRTLNREIMIANSDVGAFDRYLQRFINEFIKPLPKISFNSARDYELMFMFMFKGWNLLKNHTSTSPSKLAKLESLIEMIDRFDDDIERPIQLRAIRSITSHPDWKRIQREALKI